MESLSFIAGADFGDCGAIAGMPKLREVMIRGHKLDDVRPLLSLPVLAKVEISFVDTAENRAAVEQLRNRGVTVQTR